MDNPSLEALRHEEEKERRRIKNMIRKGVLPRYMQARGPDGKPERKKKWVELANGSKIQVDAGLTGRMISTLDVLCPRRDPLRK